MKPFEVVTVVYSRKRRNALERSHQHSTMLCLWKVPITQDSLFY